MEGLRTLKSFPMDSNSNHTDKIKKITMALQQVNCEAKEKSSHKSIDQLELRSQQLEEKLNNFRDFDAKRFKQLQEKVQMLIKMMEQERKEQKELFTEYKRSFELWAGDITQKLQHLTASSNEFETEILNNIFHNLYSSTSDELKAEETKVEQIKEDILKGLSTELSEIKEQTEEVKARHSKILREIEAGFEIQSKYFWDRFLEYKESKKESEQNIFDLIKQFVEKTQQEIEVEHQERIQQEDAILNLLDKATTKLNHLSLI